MNSTVQVKGFPLSAHAGRALSTTPPDGELRRDRKRKSNTQGREGRKTYSQPAQMELYICNLTSVVHPASRHGHKHLRTTGTFLPHRYVLMSAPPSWKSGVKACSTQRCQNGATVPPTPSSHCPLEFTEVVTVDPVTAGPRAATTGGFLQKEKCFAISLRRGSLLTP